MGICRVWKVLVSCRGDSEKHAIERRVTHGAGSGILYLPELSPSSFLVCSFSPFLLSLTKESQTGGWERVLLVYFWGRGGKKEFQAWFCNGEKH